MDHSDVGATVAMDDDGPDRAEVVKRELLLLDPAVRGDPRRVRALLHPDFVEFGASGRIWNADAIAGALAAASSLDQAAADQGAPDQGVPDQGASDRGVPGEGLPDQGANDQGAPDEGVPSQRVIALRAVDLEPLSLSAGIVLLTYRIDDPERPSLRSSVWLRSADGRWLLRFHQGTMVHSTGQVLSG